MVTFYVLTKILVNGWFLYMIFKTREYFCFDFCIRNCFQMSSCQVHQKNCPTKKLESNVGLLTSFDFLWNELLLKIPTMMFSSHNM